LQTRKRKKEKIPHKTPSHSSLCYSSSSFSSSLMRELRELRELWELDTEGGVFRGQGEPRTHVGSRYPRWGVRIL
jgi:hypothetical protein